MMKVCMVKDLSVVTRVAGPVKLTPAFFLDKMTSQGVCSPHT